MRSSGSRGNSDYIGFNASCGWSWSPIIAMSCPYFFRITTNSFSYIEMNNFTYTRENEHLPWEMKSTYELSWILCLPCFIIINLLLYFIQTNSCYFKFTELSISGEHKKINVEVGTLMFKNGLPFSTCDSRYMSDIIFKSNKFPKEYKIPSREKIRG